jgi:hypothetical protein
VPLRVDNDAVAAGLPDDEDAWRRGERHQKEVEQRPRTMLQVRMFLVALVTALATAGAFVGLGLGGQASGVRCGLLTQGTGYAAERMYVCTLRTMPAQGEPPFLLRLPTIDILCQALHANGSTNFPDTFSCDRLSDDTGDGLPKCIDSTLGSWSVSISARHFEIDSPQSCKQFGKLAGEYKLTSGYTSRTFQRNP